MKRRRSKSRWRGGLPQLRGLPGRLVLGRQAHSEPPSPPSSRRRNLRLGLAPNGRRHPSDITWWNLARRMTHTRTPRPPWATCKARVRQKLDDAEEEGKRDAQGKQ